jgi:hypothetical protein
MFAALITIAVILILYGAVSKPLDARGITSAMIFSAAGLAVGTSALKAELQVTAARTASSPQPLVPSEHACPVWLRTARYEPLPAAGDPPCGAPPGAAGDPA